MYPLFAQPNRSGFFGLRELQSFAETVMEPYSRAQADTEFTLDFSLVKVWDVSAILWLIAALHHYRQQGLRFLLRLPDSHTGMSKKDSDDFQKSADYLRRWQFDVGLQNLVADADRLLVPEQRGYFSGEPKRYYPEIKVASDSGVLESLISQRLVGMRNLVDTFSLDVRGISDTLIAKCITRFQSARMGDILNVQCDIDKRNADLFSDHLLTEGLMNMKEHPDATVGLVAVSIMGNTNELVLALVDNGKSIPSTIYSVYAANEKVNGRDLPHHYKKDEQIRKSVPKLQTSPRCPESVVRYLTTGKDVGMGLTYIKEDTLNTFHGKFRIITDSVSLKYQGKSTDPYSFEEWPHSWNGNLLRIAIPLRA